jgi:diacylglycerol kinase
MSKSFSCAVKGVLFCMKTERNFRFHLAFAFYVAIAGAVTGLSAAEWIFVLLCIGAVTGAEICNTAVEKLCDTLHPGQLRGIGLVKDMMAGAVLMASASSAVIGGIIFFSAEKLKKAAAFVGSYPFLAVLIAATLPPAAYLVFRSYKNDQKDSSDRRHRTSERRQINPRQRARR